MQKKIDILENEIKEQYPKVLDILLSDQTTKKNIIWATNNYEKLGKKYSFDSQILPSLITGKNGDIIKPRIKKCKNIQQNRSRDMAEVFTPSWICNNQNNLIDDAWFGKKNVFNILVSNNRWVSSTNKITFPDNKTWLDYVNDTRMEISCGEAPYITSRYDTTTGSYIKISDRIGILDRKLRIINENTESLIEWQEAAEIAYKNTYAFEYHGDSLLIARESMLVTYIENFIFKFKKEPSLKSIQKITYIISWNVWQMDALKGVIPNSCITKRNKTVDLFGEVEITESPCKGCLRNNIRLHNGKYCLVKDWGNKNEKNGVKIKFIDLIKEH